MAEPVLITSHWRNNAMHHYAWSPAQYNGDVIGHPLMHPDYRNFVHQVLNNINENELGELCHTYTDFHSSTLLNNRGVTAYVCVSFDHVVSPVFFSVINLHSYVNQFPENNVVHIIPHQTV